MSDASSICDTPGCGDVARGRHALCWRCRENARVKEAVREMAKTAAAASKTKTQASVMLVFPGHGGRRRIVSFIGGEPNRVEKYVIDEEREDTVGAKYWHLTSSWAPSDASKVVNILTAAILHLMNPYTPVEESEDPPPATATAQAAPASIAAARDLAAQTAALTLRYHAIMMMQRQNMMQPQNTMMQQPQSPIQRAPDAKKPEAIILLVFPGPDGRPHRIVSLVGEAARVEKYVIDEEREDTVGDKFWHQMTYWPPARDLRDVTLTDVLMSAILHLMRPDAIMANDAELERREADAAKILAQAANANKSKRRMLVAGTDFPSSLTHVGALPAGTRICSRCEQYDPQHTPECEAQETP